MRRLICLTLAALCLGGCVPKEHIRDDEEIYPWQVVPDYDKDTEAIRKEQAEAQCQKN